MNESYKQGLNQSVWRAIADSIGWWAGGYGTFSAYIAMRLIGGSPAPALVIATAAFAFAFLSFVIALVAVNDHSINLAVLGLSFATLSGIMDAYAYTKAGEPLDPSAPATKKVAAVTLLIDLLTGGTALAEMR